MFSSKDIFLTPPSGGYTIGKSVRLRSSASAYLNRTPSSSTNRRISTFSAWIKWSLTGSSAFPEIFSAAPNGLIYKDALYFSNNTLSVIFNGGITYSLVTTQVFRDPSAWYHFVMAIDTTQATASNRVKLYVNGVQITAFSTANYPIQNYDPNFNSAIVHNIGRSTDANDYFDGYLTEINFIDGQALTPSSFGSTNALTGVWQPAKYTGSYGTNGFYLNFSSNSTAAALGTDFSGNSNTWTVNNISVTAGATYDSMTDVPTLTSATVANYCVMNPNNASSSSVSVTSGNLDLSIAANATCAVSTMAVTSGKWYWEFTAGTASQNAYYVSVCDVNNWSAPSKSQTDMYNSTYVWTYYGNNGNKITNATATAYGSSFTSGDVIGVALDMDAGTVVFYKNNTSQGTAFSVFAGKTIAPMIGNGASTTSSAGSINFGQRPFSYTPPTGYVALNTYNLPTSTITNGAAYMAATLYTGTGASLAISNAVNGISFQPDLVWMKRRNTTGNNVLQDSIRGVNSQLFSNSTTSELTGSSDITSFNSGGFTIAGTDTDTGASGSTYVGWQWKAGGTSSSNTNGSITSTVSAGATQGFSVATYTGNGSAGATFGHGLGVAPNFVIIKERGNANGWLCYHSSTGNTGYLELDATLSFQTLSTVWNNTTPSSSVVTLGTVSNVNRNGGTFVAYCFAAVKGFSAFGSYTGNNSNDGPFVYLGFRPRFVMFKDSTSAGAWMIMDSSRETYNVEQNGLAPNNSNAESTYSGTPQVDFLSNGFKIRANNANAYWNNISGNTYIYAAFAEVPFKSALGR